MADTFRSAVETRVPPESLRWVCDPSWLDFESTAEVEPIAHVVGQDDAIESLRFGLEIHAPGQNVFVRGLSGSGRLTLLRHLLDEVRLDCADSEDRAYVFDFQRADRPRLLTLPRGEGRRFARRVDELVEFLGEELVPAISSDAFRQRRDALHAKLEHDMQALVQPFEEQLREQGLALVSVDAGGGSQPAIVPLHEGQPTMPEAYEHLIQEGKVDEETQQKVIAAIQAQGPELERITGEIEKIQEHHRGTVRALLQSETRSILQRRVARIARDHPSEGAKRHLQAIVDDVVEHRLAALGEGEIGAFTRRYRVNVVVDRTEEEGCPVVAENAPTLQNLLGALEREITDDGGFRSDHMLIRAGALMRADGGYLLLEAKDLLEEPGAWRALTRTLRTGCVDMVPPEAGLLPHAPLLHPEPAEVRLKVVLIGDPDLYYALDEADPEFAQLFKVLADFDSTLPRAPESLAQYAGVLSKIAKEESLLPLHRDAVAALAEHGARIASRNDRLTTRFGRVADIAREASYRARKRGADVVDSDTVRETIRAIKRRADLPSRRFRKLVAEGTLRVDTRGQVVGQVNGLAVVHAGPLTYGFPARITAAIGAGSKGAINIESEAHLSGAIHTKGFQILGGLLRRLLQVKHPLAFSASIAFEQSYGGIDGDSASGAEICCLISALTDVPLRQDLAMTGAIDQLGHVQAIGAVNEKIEGFFDTCRDIGLNGQQGVIVPRSNAVDLMLRQDVVEACAEGNFHVYAVDTIQQALELFTGMPAGELDTDGNYAEGTLLRRAVDRAGQFWAMVSPD